MQEECSRQKEQPSLRSDCESIVYGSHFRMAQRLGLCGAMEAVLRALDLVLKSHGKPLS